MKAWEYKQVAIEITEVIQGRTEGLLNELGVDGWELVSAVQREKAGHSHDVYFFFKRERT